MTTRTRKTKSAAELKADLEKAKANLVALEQRAFAIELDELIKKTNIVSDFNVLKANASGASELTILSAIGKACGMKRLVVSQSAPIKRKAKTNDS